MKSAISQKEGDALVFFKKRQSSLTMALLCALLGCQELVAAQPDWPAVPQMPKGRSYWVAPNIEQNGIPMRILRIEGPWTQDQALAFYRRWAADKPDAKEILVNGQPVVSARVARARITAHISHVDKPTSSVKTLVTLSWAHLHENVKLPQVNLPLPIGTQVVSVTRSFDQGSTNDVITAISQLAPETSMGYLREHLIAGGWQIVEANTLEPGHSAVMVARRQAGNLEELQLSLVRQPRQGVVLVASHTRYEQGAP